MSGGCKGLHCGGCKGGGAIPVGLIVVIVLGVWAYVQVGPAIAAAFHVLAVVLEVVLITIASAAGTGVLTGLTWAGVRIHRRYAIRFAAADRRSLSQPVRVTAEVVRSEPQAIEAPKPRLASPPPWIRKGVNR